MMDRGSHPATTKSNPWEAGNAERDYRKSHNHILSCLSSVTQVFIDL